MGIVHLSANPKRFGISWAVIKHLLRLDQHFEMHVAPIREAVLHDVSDEIDLNGAVAGHEAVANLGNDASVVKLMEQPHLERVAPYFNAATICSRFSLAAATSRAFDFTIWGLSCVSWKHRNAFRSRIPNPESVVQKPRQPVCGGLKA